MQPRLPSRLAASVALVIASVVPAASAAPVATAAPAPTHAQPASSPSTTPSGPAAGKPAPTMRRLQASEVTELARAAITAGGSRLPKGATLVTARATLATPATEIPIAPSRISLEVTPPARKAGPVRATGVLVFWRDVEVAARLPVQLDLSVSPEALVYDVPKGATVTVVVRRGLVEVSSTAVSSADADVGDVVQLLLRPSGRAIRATVIAKDRAVAVEDAR